MSFFASCFQDFVFNFWQFISVAFSLYIYCWGFSELLESIYLPILSIFLNFHKGWFLKGTWYIVLFFFFSIYSLLVRLDTVYRFIFKFIDSFVISVLLFNPKHWGIFAFVFVIIFCSKISIYFKIFLFYHLLLYWEFLFPFISRTFALICWNIFTKCFLKVFLKCI